MLAGILNVFPGTQVEILLIASNIRTHELSLGLVDLQL